MPCGRRRCAAVRWGWVRSAPGQVFSWTFMLFLSFSCFFGYGAGRCRTLFSRGFASPVAPPRFQRLFHPVFDAHGDAGLLVAARRVERTSGRELLVGIGSGDLEDAHAGRSHTPDLRAGILGDLLGAHPGIGRSGLDESHLHVVEPRVVVVRSVGFDRDALGDERGDFARDGLDTLHVPRLDREALPQLVAAEAFSGPVAVGVVDRVELLVDVDELEDHGIGRKSLLFEVLLDLGLALFDLRVSRGDLLGLGRDGPGPDDQVRRELRLAQSRHDNRVLRTVLVGIGACEHGGADDGCNSQKEVLCVFHGLPFFLGKFFVVFSRCLRFFSLFPFMLISP